MTSSTGRSRRSARLEAEFRKAATELVAVASRTASIPAEMEGVLMLTTRAMTMTTTIISMSVTPRRPADLLAQIGNAPSVPSHGLSMGVAPR
jgi:hypothetical protein